MSSLSISFQEKREFFEEYSWAFSLFFFREVLIDEGDDIFDLFSIIVEWDRVYIVHCVFLVTQLKQKSLILQQTFFQNSI